MAFQVFDSILPLAVGGLVQVLHDPGACRPRSFEVRIHILDEYGEALRSIPGVRRTIAPPPRGIERPRAIEHDPGIAKMHLRALYRLAIAVVLDETERFREPDHRIGNTLVRDVG